MNTNNCRRGNYSLVLAYIARVSQYKEVMVMKKRNVRGEKGQGMVEYIIIIVIVALAALTVMGIFSDRLRALIAGAASTLGSDNAAEEYQNTNSMNILQNMDEDGLDTGG